MKTLKLLLSVIALPMVMSAKPSSVYGDENLVYAIDSNSDIMATSESNSTDDEEDSFIKRIIPPTPQSSALAKYGEHPVDLSTGLVDISVPIYTIEMGDFKLPISLSYHASGIRVTDIATPVGLGWVLNAGGAISRTVNGSPDPIIPIENKTEYDRHYKYCDYDEVKSVVNDHNISMLDILANSTEENASYDLESDRYSYNFAGHSGIMRFDYKQNKYVPLNYEVLTIGTYGDRSAPCFRVVDSNGYEYYFEAHEHTGLSDEANPIITSWYLTRIDTAYGSITISYKNAPVYNLRTDTQYAEVGKFWYVEYYDNGDFEDKCDVIADISPSIQRNTYYKELLVDEISWDEHKIKFNYASGRQIITGFQDEVDLTRLESIKVYNSSNDCIRTATLYHKNWGSKIDNTRMMLSSVQLSDEGTYGFTYNGTSSNPLPNYNITGTYKCDYWGYYNGNQSYVVPKTAYENCVKNYERNYEKVLCNYGGGRLSNRDCDAEKMQYGVLNQISYPTGGYTFFTYEPHQLSSNVEDIYGGLRIRYIQTSDADGNFTSRSFKYTGLPHTLHPSEMMTYERHVLFQKTLGLTVETHYIVDGSPYFFSTCGMSCPLEYTQVKEIDSNGITKTIDFKRAIKYQYTEDYIDVDGVGTVHPSVFNMNCYDEGNTPMLPIAQTITDSDGNIVLKEIYDYEGFEVSSFNAGVRIYKTNDFDDDAGYVLKSELCHAPYLYYKPIKCVVKTFQTVKKTVVDCSTGFTSEQSFTYDSQNWRTLQPRSISTLRSDGKTEKMAFEYVADCGDSSSKYLYETLSIGDAVKSVTTTIDGNVIRKSQIDYSTFNGSIADNRVWALPAIRYEALGDGPLVERERILGFNSHGRPLAIVTNRADTTCFEWTNYIYLSQITAPGGLQTKYTHKPLVGITSITNPASYTLSYSYNTDGLLSGISDYRGVLSKYSYNIVTKGSNSNSVVKQTRLYDNDSASFSTNIQYYDGLGRPTILADNGGNTDFVYNYTMQQYDAVGQIVCKTLPAIGSTSAINISSYDINNLLKSTYPDSVAWSNICYDALNRPLSTTTPGDEWAALGKATTTSYISNSANDVKHYTAPIGSTSLVKSGYYAASTLQGEIVTDEDGDTFTSYKDRNGRKVLERRGDKNDTYYVYNDLGQLRFILSPEYQNAGYRDKYAYEFRYDSIGNVVKTFIPGCEAEQTWYDIACRPIFTQDSRLKDKAMHRFMLYDKAGRLCVRGLTLKSTRSSELNPVTLSTSMNTIGGYIMADPKRISVNDAEIVNYYDNYNFVNLYKLNISSDIATAKSSTGLQTGMWSKLSDGSEMLDVYFYDTLGRVIKTCTYGPFDHESTTITSYSFDETPSSITYSEGNVSYTINTNYTNRLPSVSDIVINGVKYRLTSNSYDQLGRLTSVERDQSKHGGKANYTYDIHGNLTSISYPNIGFIQNLYYATGPGIAKYNGKISAMSWIQGGEDTRMRGYCYKYDELGRLTEATYGENTTLKSNPNRYTERVLEYSANGAIKRFQRHGLKDDGVYGKIDNLHISLDGNRIQKVTDDADPVLRYASSDFEDAADKSVEYTYDGVGSLTSDLNRGITKIEYDNVGNLRKVLFSSGASTEYVYSPMGVKLRRIHHIPQVNSTILSDTTDYIGATIYHNGSVDMIRYQGGYVTFGTDNVPQFYHYITDYIGNNRGVINAQNGNIDQITAYYPFGAPYADFGNGSSVQSFKFCNKELDLMHGLDTYDFEARSYYPIVPTFDRPDPMATKYPWLSPYAYCANDPVNAVDTNGELVIFINGFHCGFGGGKGYWDGVNKWIMKQLNDTNAMYIDGSMGGAINTYIFLTESSNCICYLNLFSGNRIDEGHREGFNSAKDVISKLGNSKETIKIITHSMGAAYAKGFIRGLLDYAKSHHIDLFDRIKLELDLAPYQPTEQSVVPGINTISFVHHGDLIASTKKMKGLDPKNRHVTHKIKNNRKLSIYDVLTEHSIKSFKGEPELKKILIHLRPFH
jgi:RHS repeat-associated protein